MNPLVLLGLGAAVLIATSKKKTDAEPEGAERKYAGAMGLQAVKAPKKPKVTVAKAMKIPILDPLAPKLLHVAAPKASYKTKIAKDGPTIARQCHKFQGMKNIEDVARCVAADLFPVSGWPATGESESWERNAWYLIINVARSEFGLGPAPKPMKAQAFKIG